MRVGDVPGQGGGLKAVGLVYLHVVGVSEAAVGGALQPGGLRPSRPAVEHLLQSAPERGPSLPPSHSSFFQIHGRQSEWWRCLVTVAHMSSCGHWYPLYLLLPGRPSYQPPPGHTQTPGSARLLTMGSPVFVSLWPLSYYDY